MPTSELIATRGPLCRSPVASTSRCRPAQALAALAPEKTMHTIKLAMGAGSASTARGPRAGERARLQARRRRFAPAGQSTQMIVGADATPTRRSSRERRTLYARVSACGASITRRSARSRDARAQLPVQAPAAGARASAVSGRLADALLRLRRTTRSSPAPRRHARPRHRSEARLGAGASRAFPVDVNARRREMLLRVPGLGVRNVKRHACAAAPARVRYADLAQAPLRHRKSEPFRHRRRLGPAHARSPPTCETMLCDNSRSDMKSPYETWRDKARAFLAAGIRPEHADWQDALLRERLPTTLREPAEELRGSRLRSWTC